MRIDAAGFDYLKKIQNKKANVQKKDTFLNTPSGSSNNNYFPNFQTVPFMRTWKEHKSWGAVYDKNTNSTSFKIFTFPDVKNVNVEVLKGDEYVKYPLKNVGGGIFQTQEAIKDVVPDDKYHYSIERADGSKTNVKDPYSFKQPTINGDSVVYDQNAYKWNDSEWFLNNDDRVASDNRTKKTINDLRILEINCATITQDGDFEGTKKAIDNASKNGFNAIEIMPVENTYSFNWGYDGCDKFATSEYLGGADKLKELIDYIHKNKMNVIMDMVPNHIAPENEDLIKTGPYIKGSNGFGSSFNYENENSTYVRDYMINAAINWLDNFHCDGLRIDMTKFMDSDITMKQIAMEVKYHKPDAFIIAEDARSNIETNGYNFWTDYRKLHDERVISPLLAEDIAVDDNQHSKLIDDIIQTSVARLGFDSEWDFQFFHSFNDYLFDRTSLEDLENVIFDSRNRVKYMMSHDEIGNCDGTRLIPKLMVDKLNLNRYVYLNSEDDKRASDYAKLKNISLNEAKRIVQCQKTQLVSEKLAVLLQSGKLTNSEDIYNLDISKDSNLSVDDVKKIYNQCYAKQKAAFALMYAIPGPKMIFQGDENADLTPFRFFRETTLPFDNENLSIEKGYKAGYDALNASKIGNIKYSNTGKLKLKNAQNLTKSLNNFSLPDANLNREKTILHPYSKVIGLDVENKDDELYVVSNFSDTNYPNQNAKEYYIEFPEGNWIEILNTDDKKYGGSGFYKNNIKTSSKKKQTKIPIKLPANSTLYFKKI